MIYVYSHESIPSDKLMGKPSYTPEWLQAWGVTLPQLKAGEWMELPDNYYWKYKKDWVNKQGTREHIAGTDVVEKLKGRFDKRGVIFLDYKPDDIQKKVFELKSKEANLAFRMTCVENYENQVREKEVTGHGRTQPTAYEDECYSILGITKPYSVEALRAQRHPGEAVGEQIVAALDRLDQRRAHDAVAAKPSQHKA
jgi:hypothetical protein